MVCNTNRGDKTINFLKSYMNNHGMPRKKISRRLGAEFHVKGCFRNNEEIETKHLPVKCAILPDRHSATFRRHEKKNE